MKYGKRTGKYLVKDALSGKAALERTQTAKSRILSIKLKIRQKYRTRRPALCLPY